MSDRATIIATAQEYWGLQDNTSGTTIAGGGAGANGGTLIGAANSSDLSAADGPLPDLPRSMLFDGFSQYVTLPTGNAIFSSGADSTVAGWAKLADTSGTQCLWESGGGAYGMAISVSGTTLSATSTRNSTTYSASGTVSAGEWFHFALVNEEDAVSLYIDGVLAERNESVGAWNNNYGNNAGGIGAANDARLPGESYSAATVEFYAEANLCDIGCWRRVLTPTEIATLAGVSSGSPLLLRSFSPKRFSDHAFSRLSF